MDFTGSVGRIVEDPKEAKAIALAEGYCWKKRWRPIVRHPSGECDSPWSLFIYLPCERRRRSDKT